MAFWWMLKNFSLKFYSLDIITDKIRDHDFHDTLEKGQERTLFLNQKKKPFSVLSWQLL
ncbi:MAG: hypothetical protein ACI9Z4_002007 [Polaribacter sp.]|jgi:hypothetical protein